MPNTNPNYMVLINGENRMPEGYEDTVELVSAENIEGTKFPVEKKTYEAYLRLQEDLLKNDGLQAELISSYRSVATQEALFQKRIAEYGEEFTRKYVAVPGHSEHHSGLAIDVSFFLDGKIVHGTENLLAMENLYQIVHKKLAQYGFILRYPKSKEDVTKIGYEPWHFRYLDSPEIAREIADREICLEEYHLKGR